MPAPSASRYDVVVVGGGHNGLTAAAYLAKAGRSVLLLERLDRTGGAAVSADAFDGLAARLSRYAYLVSLLPRTIVDDLGLDLRMVRRRYASYTPMPGDALGRGLLVDRLDGAATHGSFARIGAAADAEAFDRLYQDVARLARLLWPTVTQPLPRRGELRRRLGDDALWSALFEQPIGGFIEQRLSDDLVRGVVLTDALIGTFADADDPGLAQNRCFLYHLIGGGTGDWDVPVGGMGSVSGQLARAAMAAGAELRTGAEVVSVSPDGEVRYVCQGEERLAHGRTVLANVAPYTLDRLLGSEGGGVARPEGAQVKVNMLLRRLPALRDAEVATEAAFGGTFHINEGYAQLERAYRRAAGGAIPDPLPCEIYCHSLSDPSILGAELAASGAQTLTVFGLHAPDRLVDAGNKEAMRLRLQQAVLASLNSVLAEPIEGLLLSDASGRPCIETKTTLDIEEALAMPGGHIFHGPLSWPFAEDEEELDTPAKRWGVATTHDRLLLCGSGALRGGAVSGLGGHNAAMAVLEQSGR